MSTMFSRRNFLRASGSAGALAFAGCAGFPAITSSRSPNGKLRHACIGCGSQGRSNISKFATHKRIEMAAFCDVDMLMLDKLRAKFPKARFYQNWREMLDSEDLDSVMVATPDH
ncbi:MAG: Gfo/Idh/MocA family oxidoreductase, partial [Kiritimatiellae bacterium]|nr:Gfo/Idh/MocA family oxidoreductase [Kiritimatiellia bacterium]